jgi:glyoxylase-like metal-dependent hydrolase (beta-lactamase superfamily II)
VTAGWQEIGDGCFRRRYRAFDLNIGVVQGSDGLLVLDTRADLRQAEELLDHLAAFGQPVRWVVNSHWHFDHLFGNQRFREAAGGSGRPADAEVAADLELWGHEALPPMLARSEAEGFRADLRAMATRGDEYDRAGPDPAGPPGRRGPRPRPRRPGSGAGPPRAHVTPTTTLSRCRAPASSTPGTCWRSPPCRPAATTASSLDWPGTTDALVAAPTTFVPGHGDGWGWPPLPSRRPRSRTVASVIRALHEAGVRRPTLAEGRDRWPFLPAAARGGGPGLRRRA